MKKWFTFALVLVISACANIHTTSGLSINSNGTLQISNTSLSKKLSVTEPRSVDVAGVLKAVVTVTSKTRNDQQWQYQFQFFDRNGIEIEQDSAIWQAVNLNGKQTKQLQAVAKNDRAVSFSFNIRPIYSQN